MLTVCVLVLGLALQTQPEPRIAQGESTTEAQRAAEAERQQRAADSETMRGIFSVVTEIQKQQAAALQSDKDAIDQQADINRNMAKYTWGLLLVGVFQTLILAGTIVVIYLQVVAVRQSERAWVAVLPDPKIGPSTRKGNSFVANVWNSGKTVAKIKYTFSTMRRIQSLDELIAPNYSGGSNHKDILPPVPVGTKGSMQLSIGFATDPLTSEEFTAITDKTLLLYAYGLIEYRDSFEKDRTTKFGFLWTPTPNEPAGTGEWQRAGPDAYNENT